MIFMKKKKEQPLILYEKYKYDHHLNTYEESAASKEKVKIPLAKRLCNMLATCILIGMIFLSAIGVITLMNPQMRAMLELVVGL